MVFPARLWAAVRGRVIFSLLLLPKANPGYQTAPKRSSPLVVPDKLTQPT